MTKEIIEKYKNLFVEKIDNNTICLIGQHEIELTDTKPVYEHNGRIPIIQESLLNKEINKLEERGIIEKCESKWSSRIVPVQKNDGSIRLCIDYRSVNKQTLMNKYPMKRIDDIYDKISSAQIFSSLDATSGYYQIAMHPDHKKITAFKWKGVSYQFNRMLFGLCGAPSTFQEIMDQVFA